VLVLVLVLESFGLMHSTRPQGKNLFGRCASDLSSFSCAALNTFEHEDEHEHEDD
jgi:hypothetical protein